MQPSVSDTALSVAPVRPSVQCFYLETELQKLYFCVGKHIILWSQTSCGPVFMHIICMLSLENSAIHLCRYASVLSNENAVPGCSGWVLWMFFRPACCLGRRLHRTLTDWWSLSISIVSLIVPVILHPHPRAAVNAYGIRLLQSALSESWLLLR